MAEVIVTEYFILADVYISANSQRKEISISQKDWEISLSLPQQDEVEFVETVLSIIKRIESILQDFYIDEASAEDIKRKRNEILDNVKKFHFNKKNDITPIVPAA